ncbi:MAG TPA: hypothetical protein EYH54_04110 [Nautiliaceae bacterium]|nr:hypothetical protein [Nautiliaceae bacterium]
MSFEEEKKKVLFEYKNALKKGLVDKKIVKILDLINRNPYYYTTSSCSGRISLDIEGNKKKEHFWIFKSHKIIKEKDLKKVLDFALEKNLNNLFLKVDSFILHVVCKNLDFAKKILNIAQNLGLKRSGIIQLDKKILVEILGLDRLEIPLLIDKDLVINLNVLDKVVFLVNKKLIRNWERLEIFYLSLKKELGGGPAGI